MKNKLVMTGQEIYSSDSGTCIEILTIEEVIEKYGDFLKEKEIQKILSNG